MKNALLLVTALLLPALLPAEEAGELKNAIGYDGGISYRRKISDTYWLGASLVADHATSQRTYTVRNASDSITSYDQYDYTHGYANLGISLIKEWLSSKYINMDIYATVSPGINYDTDDEIKPGYSLSGSLGLRPNIIIAGRLKLETVIGYTLMYKSDKRSRTDDDGEMSTRVEEDITLDTFGPRFSINMSMTGYFLF